MSGNFFDGTARSPLDGKALSVVSKGFSYEFDESNKNRQEFDIQPEIRKCIEFDALNLTGTKYGRFTVLGMSTKNRRAVCRCACGKYVLVKSVAIKNKKFPYDACFQCKTLMDKRRKYHYLKTGKDLPESYFFES